MQLKIGKGRHITAFTLLMLAVGCYFCIIIVSQQVYGSQVIAEQEEAEARLAAAQKENAELRAEKERLGDLAYIERIAREELGMTRRGELPYSTGHK